MEQNNCYTLSLLRCHRPAKSREVRIKPRRLHRTIPPHQRHRPLQTHGAEALKLAARNQQRGNLRRLRRTHLSATRRAGTLKVRAKELRDQTATVEKREPNISVVAEVEVSRCVESAVPHNGLLSVVLPERTLISSQTVRTFPVMRSRSTIRSQFRQEPQRDHGTAQAANSSGVRDT